MSPVGLTRDNFQRPLGGTAPLVMSAVVLLAVVGVLVADLRLGILTGLVALAGLAFVFLREESVVYLLPLAFVLPDRGVDLPGPFAILMWDAMTVAIVGGILVRRVLARRPIATVDPWLFRLLWLFVAAAAVSTIQAVWYADNVVAVALKELTRLVELALFFVAVVSVLNSGRRIRLLSRNLVLAGAASLVLALAGHFVFTGPFYRAIALEPNYVLIGRYLLRMASTAGNVSATGTFLLLTIGLTSYYIRRANAGPARLAAAVLWTGLAAGILLTYNKGTWQAALFGTIAFVLAGRMRKRYVVAVLLALGALALAVFYEVRTQGPVGVIVSDLQELFVSSGRVRVLRWFSLAKVLAAHPILGVGYNCFAYQYGRYAIELGASEYGHPHNLYVDIAAGTGVVGITLFLLFIARLVVIAWNNARATDGPLDDLPRYHHMMVWFFLAANLTSSFFFKAGHPAYYFMTLAAVVVATRNLTLRSREGAG